MEALGLDAIDETRAFNAALVELLATQPPVEAVGAAAARAARREGRSFWPPPVYLDEARDVTIVGRTGEIRLRVLAPRREARGVYLHVHGGGWALGAADLQDSLLAEIAEESGLAVVSVDYRLAPEHPYPAAVDDCEDAALWVLGEGRRELGAGAELALGGESAGAHLAVLTLLRLRVSPLYADLSGLPPALFTVGTLDPLLDDSLFMAARWRAGGNEAELRVWHDGAHGFTAFPLEIARRSFREQLEFLRR